jgi:adenylate cyclase
VADDDGAPVTGIEGPSEDQIAELVAFVRTLGATDEQIDAARRECKLAQLSGDLVLSRGATMTAGDVAISAGTSVHEVLRLWRTLGVSIPDETTAMFSERDADFTRHALVFEHIGPHGDELFRVLGGSLQRVAEAAVSYYVQTVQPEGGFPDDELLDWAKAVAEAIDLSMRLGDSMGTIFAHHMRDAIERQRLAQADVPERSLFRLAVGFVDLVGFTPLARTSAPAALLELISRFEEKAFDVAVSNDGRIVKHIGDEVMFVSLEPAAACRIAQALMEGLDVEGVSPRCGLAFGDVISRHGDYYGPVVNLASRLADLAIPHEVLADSAMAAVASSAAFRFVPAGNRLLKGFDQAVEVFSLEPAHTPDSPARRPPVGLVG